MQYQFRRFNAQEHVDFEVSSVFTENPRGGRPPLNYALSLNLAAKISLVSRSPFGEEARDYFIAMSKRTQSPAQTMLASANTKPSSSIQILLQTVQAMADQENRLVTDVSADLGSKSGCIPAVSHGKRAPCLCRQKTTPAYI